MTTTIEPETAIEKASDAAIKPELLRTDGTPTPAGWRVISAHLQQPIPTKKRAGRGGLQFSYIDARQVQDRLDAVVGPGNWSTSFRIIDLDRKAVECTLTIFGVSKCDAGYSNNPEAPEYIEAKDRQTGQRLIDETTGEVKMIKNPAWEDEPFKAAYSDSFKRAAVSFGIGRFLYDK